MFVLCLSLGVTALAGVGSVLSAIERGLAESGRSALGGDAELRLVHRFASDREQAFLAGLGTVSRAVSFRSMVSRAGSPATERTLAQVKAVDRAYPLYGTLLLDPPLSPEAAFGLDAEGRYGFAAAPELAERLGLAPGDTVRLGDRVLEYRATIVTEPDRISADIRFGPRAFVSVDAIDGSGLLAPGSLFYTRYRMRLPDGADLESLREDIYLRFPEAGWRWRDRRVGAPTAQRFVQRVGSFLSLAGLAALVLGGIGASAAIRTYFQQKTVSIAVLRSFGATRSTVTTVLLAETLAIASLGVGIGVALGGLLPLLLGPLLTDLLPVPAQFGLYAAPLARAALAGYLTAVFFSLLPLARTCAIPAAALFRDGVLPPWSRPPPGWVLALAASGGALAALAFTFGAAPFLATGFLTGFALILVLLVLTGSAIARLAAFLSARMRIAPAALRRAVTRLGSAASDARGVCVSLGAGMSVLTAIALTDHSLRASILELADDETPAYFVIDIPPTELEAFRSAAAEVGASRVITAPMLRGFLTGLDGVPAHEAVIDPDGAWMLRGDRGVTYAEQPPEGARLAAGEWWPADYTGPPLVSFAAEEAAELGLKIGSRLTVNLLGRPLTATVANLREIEWERLGMNFLMVFNPEALRDAPHAEIATVYLPAAQNSAFLRALTQCCRSATAVSVREVIAQARETLGQVAAATLWGSAITLLTGFAVLAGAAAAGQRRQIREGAILKALGATRPEILATLALQWLLLGAAAGMAALLFGSLAAWATLRYVMDAPFIMSVPLALATVLAGCIASLIAGMAVAGAALRASPATLFRARG